MSKPRVEILYFDVCPNHEPTRELVELIATELGVEPEIDLIEVPDPDAAVRLRFLGPPTVRINGRDMEPGADERCDFVFSCRVYRREYGVAGVPDETWIRDSLTMCSMSTRRAVFRLSPDSAAALRLSRGVCRRLGGADLS